MSLRSYVLFILLHGLVVVQFLTMFFGARAASAGENSGAASRTPMIVSKCVLRGRSLCDTYSVLDVGKAGVPRLSRAELNWLHRIRGTPAYAMRWKHLRFVTGLHPRGLPLIVFDDEGQAAYGLGGLYAIIGIPCGGIYDPTEGMVEAMPMSACVGATSEPVAK